MNRDLTGTEFVIDQIGANLQQAVAEIERLRREVAARDAEIERLRAASPKPADG